MIRIPLRPLARILDARAKGENPDAIERENKRIRHEQMRDQARTRAEGRLLVLGMFFFCAFAVVGGRMGLLATSDPSEPQATAPGSEISAARADIVDRHGRILATNFETHALYAQPPMMIEPKRAAAGLVEIFPELDEKRLVKDFTGARKFLWVKRKISPEQMQAVHELGEPGLLFGPREMRLYPNGALAAHVLGGATYGKEGVSAAEVIGVAGVEKYFDDYLRDPANGNTPLELSIDLTVQAATEKVLYDGMRLMNAKGATSVLMDVHTGEVLSVVSLPDFDPNNRPRPLIEADNADQGDSPLFNRFVQGVYELGSAFKIFTAAQAIDLGLVNANTVFDTNEPLVLHGHRIGEFQGKRYGDLSVRNIIVESSNRGTGRMALMIGPKRQKQMMDDLGMLKATPFEIVEAATGKPLYPEKWTDLSAVTISYGHGISTSPLHLAAGYGALANGGRYISPTLLKQDGPRPGRRVLSEQAAQHSREMLRAVVTDGTASMGNVPGYDVGGKTGTADKPRPQGGYYAKKTIATFAAMFPTRQPKYVLVVTLDEPVETSGKDPRRTAGWTAVPIAGEIIQRIAPLLGLRPETKPVSFSGGVLTSSQ
ncbi:MAG: peptidoglycan D,D-transpeptidase FtsI family protein [Paracoccaceae bacterium]